MDSATELEAMGSTRSTLAEAQSEIDEATMILDDDASELDEATMSNENMVEEMALLMGAELEDAGAEALEPSSDAGETSEIVEEAASIAELGTMGWMILKLMSLGKGDSSIDIELLMAPLLSETKTELPGALSELGAIDGKTPSDERAAVPCSGPAISESLKLKLDDVKVTDDRDLVMICDNMGDVSSSGNPMSHSIDGRLNALDPNDEVGVPCNGSPISESMDDVGEALEVDMAGKLPSGRPMYQSLDSELDAITSLEAGSEISGAEVSSDPNENW